MNRFYDSRDTAIEPPPLIPLLDVTCTIGGSVLRAIEIVR